jgi:uncharacterized protein YqgC (DUF456 family)
LNFWSDIALPLVTLGIMLLGLFSLLIVILPGLVIIWLAALGFALISGLNTTGSIILFIIITVLMVFGSLIDNVIMGTRARQAGAPWSSILLALVAGLVGSILLPPFGGIFFILGALLLLEYNRQRDWQKALSTTKSMAVGCGLAVVVRFGTGLLMIILWAVWLFFFR